MDRPEGGTSVSERCMMACQGVGSQYVQEHGDMSGCRVTVCAGTR